MEAQELCPRQLLKERIKIEPKYITKNYRQELLNRLRQKVEGICSKHGYVRKDSIAIHKIVPGMVELTGLNGSVVYEVYFHADVCNPLIGGVIKGARVVNMNRFGILCDARVADDRFATSIMDVIVAKNSVNISSEVDLDSVKIGEELNVEIVGKKFNIGDKKISVIGRVVKDAKRDARFRSMNYDPDEDEDGEEIVEPDPVIEGEELEEEAEESEKEESEEENEEDEEDEVEDKAGGSDFFSDEEFADDADDAVEDDSVSDTESI